MRQNPHFCRQGIFPKWRIKSDYKHKISRKWGKKPHFRLIFGRSGRIRTDGIEVPNFARYQLRHTPIGENIQFFCQIRKWSNLWSKVFCRNTRRRKSEKTRGKRRFCELSAVGSRGGHTLPNQAPYHWATPRNQTADALFLHLLLYHIQTRLASLFSTKGNRSFQTACGAVTAEAAAPYF